MENVKETEEWKKVISDMAHIVQGLEKEKEREVRSKSRKDNIQTFSTVISIVLGVIFLITLISTPFTSQKEQINELENDIKTIQQYMWLKLPESDKYIDNPFTNRSGTIGLYGSEMYCNLAYN